MSLTLLAAASLLIQSQSGRVAAWREDLQFLAKELPARHLKGFHTVSRETFEKAVTQLDKELAQLTDVDVQMRMVQLVAMIGDAHTVLEFDDSKDLYFPVGFTWLDDGIFVGGTGPNHADLLGAKLESIDGQKIQSALMKVESIVPSENPYWYRAMVPRWFSNASILRALRITKSDSFAEFTFAMPSGSKKQVKFESTRLPQDKPFLTAFPFNTENMPLRRQNSTLNYWWKLLPESKAVFLAFNQCAEDQEHAFKTTVEDLMNEIDSGGARKLIVDLRRNGGGNSIVIWPLLGAIKKRPDLNKKGSLYVLIGPQTFSSAMMNAQQFRDQTQATLVGEPTGGKPNSYGEVKSFQLPNSKLKVHYCTKYFRQIAKSDPDSVYPDVKKPMDSKAYFAGKDPALDWVLSQR